MLAPGRKKIVMSDHIRVDFQHPDNAGILAHLRQGSQDAVLPDGSPEDHPDPYMRLGTHPELVARLWKDITVLLPEKCQWIINNRPVLVHPVSGIIFGYAEGTLAYALRLPPAEYEEAIQKGATRIHKYLHSTFDLAAVGEGWVFGKWRQDEPRWCLAAYEFAGEGKETHL